MKQYEITKVPGSLFLHGIKELTNNTILKTFSNQMEGVEIVEDLSLEQNIIPYHEGLDLFFTITDLAIPLYYKEIPPHETRVIRNLQEYFAYTRMDLQDSLVEVERNRSSKYRDVYLFVYTKNPYYGCVYDGDDSSPLFYSKEDAINIIHYYGKDKDRLLRILNKKPFPQTKMTCDLLSGVFRN